MAARYLDNIYIGKILKTEDGDYNITFMVAYSKSPLTYKWPIKSDNLWMERTDIFVKVAEPILQDFPRGISN